METSALLAYDPLLEHHHPVMSMLRETGGRLYIYVYIERVEKISLRLKFKWFYFICERLCDYICLLKTCVITFNSCLLSNLLGMPYACYVGNVSAITIISYFQV